LEFLANEPSAESESESPIVSGQVQSSEAEVQSVEIRTESSAKSEIESESDRAVRSDGNQRLESEIESPDGLSELSRPSDSDSPITTGQVDSTESSPDAFADPS
jgi:hypothetical protein